MIPFPLTDDEYADIRAFARQDPSEWTWNAKTVTHDGDTYRLVLGRFLAGDAFHAHIEYLPHGDGDLARPVSLLLTGVRPGDTVALADGDPRIDQRVIRFVNG